MIAPELIEQRRQAEIQIAERQKDRKLELIKLAKEIVIENRRLMMVSEATDISMDDLVSEAEKLASFVEN